MMYERLKSCRLCPRNCGADRLSGRKGACLADSRLMVARAALHFWEEPCISGENGSGTVFFSGCPLGCIYCQNDAIKEARLGKIITQNRLSDIFLELQDKGALNINLVTPTHYVLHIKEALTDAKKRGLTLPVVYNTGGYEKTETLKELDGLIDIYLPDFKYIKSETAKNYSNAPDYPEVIKEALYEMFRQTKKAEFSPDGIMKKGMIVRHLVLPHHTIEAKQIIKYLHNTFGDDIYISIMNQYTPIKNSELYPHLSEKLPERKYREVIDYALALGVKNAFIQEGETQSSSFIPDFNSEGV